MLKMQNSVTNKQGVQVVKVFDLRNEFENRPLLDEVKTKIDEGFINFVVDLSDLGFMNSTGLSFLLAILTKSRTAGGETCIVGISEQIDQLLVITKLKALFSIYNSEQEAIDVLVASAKSEEE